MPSAFHFDFAQPHMLIFSPLYLSYIIISTIHTLTIAGGSYVSIPSYNPHTGLDTNGPTSYAPSNGTPSNNYGTVATTSIGGGGGTTGENYDDVRAMLHSMMDNPSW